VRELVFAAINGLAEGRDRFELVAAQIVNVLVERQACPF
jgi:hypothetical protein